jgi:hypothetical protein
MRIRRKGTVLFDDSLTVHPAVAEAKKQQRQKQELIRLRREARPERPLLNRDRYPNMYDKWLAKGRGKLPNCPVCREAVIHWDEPAHVCEGFKPMFTEHDQEWQDKMEARRQAIREAKRERTILCSECGEEMPELEDAEWHWNDHEGRPEREHQAVNGDEDDLSGYEDEPEDDYCEDDGDPMWE